MMRMMAWIGGMVLAVGILVAGERPNILFALADDWGWPHAGAYGDGVVRTPTFDRLAREGVLFDHAYVSSPSCTPCRNSILTGQQFYRLGEGANLHSTLDAGIPNFMFLLREAGYEIGHWRKAWGPGDFEAGGYREHPCGPGSTFEEFMARRVEGRPFCFWLGTSDPHRPYELGSGERGGVEVGEVRVPGFLPDTEEVRGDLADYYAEVERWDGDVGRALALLERVGELENTLVVMTGDNGMPFPRGKANLYDLGVRMPLAMRWGSRVGGGRRVGGFVSLTDLAPTFLEVAGVEVPGVMTGRSVLSLLTGRGEGVMGRDFVVFGRERHTPAQAMPSVAGYPSRGIRTGRWLLVLNLEPGRWPAGVAEGGTHPMDRFADCDDGPTKRVVMGMEGSEEYRLCFGQRPAVELYDCEADPDQLRNVAGELEYAVVVEELTGRLREYLERTGDPRFTGDEVKFDGYRYRTGYLKARLEGRGYALPWD